MLLIILGKKSIDLFHTSFSLEFMCDGMIHRVAFFQSSDSISYGGKILITGFSSKGNPVIYNLDFIGKGYLR